MEFSVVSVEVRTDPGGTWGSDLIRPVGEIDQLFDVRVVGEILDQSECAHLLFGGSEESARLDFESYSSNFTVASGKIRLNNKTKIGSYYLKICNNPSDCEGSEPEGFCIKAGPKYRAELKITVKSLR